MNRNSLQNYAEPVGFDIGKAGSSTGPRAVHWLLLGLLLLVSYGCSRRRVPALAALGDLPVPAAMVVETNVPIELHATGRVTPVATATVRSRVDGTLEKAYFQEGEEVTKGSLIFSIDHREFQVALDQATAILERDRAMLRCEQIKENSQAEQVQEGIVLPGNSNQDYANANALAAAVATDEAVAASAQIRRSFCDIHAPISGRTSIVNVSANVCVRKHDFLVAIHQMKPIYVDFPVPSGELPLIRACLKAAGSLPIKVNMLGGDQDSPAGQLTSLDDKVNDGNGTTCLRAIFPNKRELLLPGGHVNIVLTLTTITNAIVVPAGSVQSGRQGQHVFVVKPDSTVEARPVLVGNQIGSETILLGGVKVGEIIVNGRQTGLKSGIKVRIQNPTSIAVDSGQ